MSYRARLMNVEKVANEALLRAIQAAEGGGLEPVPVQLRYVAPSGSDANGNGSFAQPFATIEHAETVITDATALKPYSIQVAPGIFSEAITLKSFISICGIDPSNPPRLDGALSLDAGFVGGLGLSDLELTHALALVLPNTNPIVSIQHCKWDSTFSVTGNAASALTTLRLGDNEFVGASTLTDIAEIVSQGNVFDGGVTADAATAAMIWASSNDALRGNLGVTAAALQTIAAVLVGSQVNGGLTLTGAGVTYRGTAGAIPPAVTLAGGAGAPSLLSSANGLSYLATTVADWSGTNPTSIKNALDRIAAKITPIP